MSVAGGGPSSSPPSISWMDGCCEGKGKRASSAGSDCAHLESPLRDHSMAASLDTVQSGFRSRRVMISPRKKEVTAAVLK